VITTGQGIARSPLCAPDVALDCALPFRFAMMQTHQRAEDCSPYLFIKSAAIAEISRVRIV